MGVAIEINPDKNLNPEVHSFEGFSSEQGDVITLVQGSPNYGPRAESGPRRQFTRPRFGHNAVNCRAAPRCVVCSGAHNSRECLSPSTRSCCNCSGNHTANYGGCPKIRQAREVEKIRQIQKLSYWDAARQVLHAGGTSLVQPHSDQTLNISMVTQSGAKDQYSSKAQSTKLVSVSTQTGDELISPTSPNVTVTQLVEYMKPCHGSRRILPPLINTSYSQIH
ncbi:hypothetical protein FHG87_024509 [Trinorchestia longiramus]|nr:hypothetical protein FHG87_024509 [Trinorchestia longiramus]